MIEFYPMVHCVALISYLLVVYVIAIKYTYNTLGYYGYFNRYWSKTLACSKVLA
jgi:hypothetical protein